MILFCPWLMLIAVCSSLKNFNMFHVEHLIKGRLIMSTERVMEYLKKWGRENDVIEAKVSTATVPQAADALGVEPGRIAKSITLRNGRGGGLMVVASGDAKIDNKKFKQYFGFSPRMLSSEEAYTLTGYQVGGVCPFDLSPNVNVYLDESLLRFDAVYPACGSSSSMIKINNAELSEYSKSSGWVDVCRIAPANSDSNSDCST